MPMLFATLGAAAGAAQALALRRSAKAPSPVSWLLRLAGVAGVLVLAATRGHVLVAAAGWAGAFFLSTWLLARGLK